MINELQNDMVAWFMVISLLVYHELFVKSLTIVFNTLNQLRLISTDGTTNVRADEQRVEAWENAEHFVSIFRSAKLITYEELSDENLQQQKRCLVFSNNRWPLKGPETSRRPELFPRRKMKHESFLLKLLSKSLDHY